MSTNLSDLPEYAIWAAMKQRCLNPNNPRFHRYGGRGVSVDPGWVQSFSVFLADMGPRPSSDYSIDRADNDGDYTPENCRWATRAQQGSNQTSNRLITFQGRTQILQQWADELGVGSTRLRNRLDRGWSVEKTLTRGRYKRSFSEEDEENIRRRADSGESSASISKDFGVSRLTVWRFLTGKKS